MQFNTKSLPPLEPDLTPMIDMTFNLIAFFVMLINFSQSEQNDKVILPTSELARPAEAPIEHPIVVHLTRDGKVSVGGSEVELEALRSRLGPEISLIKLEGKLPSDALIIIRGHEGSPGGRVQDLIKKCQELGFEKFALRAREKV